MPRLPEALAERATRVETEWVPRFEVAQQTARSEADDKNLIGLTMDMKILAELPKEELITTLRHIETAYGIWIKAEENKLSLPSEKLAGHEDAARRAVRSCTRALERIKSGIDLIAVRPTLQKKLFALPTAPCGSSASIPSSPARCARKS